MTMSLRIMLDNLETKFQQALANPQEGYFPVIRYIHPYVKRPPFNQTHKIKG